MVDSVTLVVALTLALGSFAASAALGAIGVLAVRKGHLGEVGRPLALVCGASAVGLAGLAVLAAPVTAPMLLGGTIGAGGMGVGTAMIGSDLARKARRALE